MAEIQHLAKAPVEESIVELRVTQREGFEVGSLEKACELVATDFPKKLVTKKFSGELQVGPKASVENIKNWVFGYRVESEPKRHVMQFNADAFVFSWLRPYQTWDEFIRFARNGWKVYSKVSQPVSTSRIGTRFVNRIQLPIEGLDFEDYFTVFPRIPPTLPQNLRSFLSRVSVPSEDGRSTTTITTALEGGAGTPGFVGVILDIDVFAEAPNIRTDSDAWDLIESFRALKNKAFFGSLTEKAILAYL